MNARRLTIAVFAIVVFLLVAYGLLVQSAGIAAPVLGNLGVNGITFKGNTLYGINYDVGTVFKVPLVNGAPGPASVLVTDPNLVTGDGVVLDADGTLLIAVNTGAIATVGRDSSVAVPPIDPSSLDYPTQAVFGTGNNRTTLFVTNDWFDVGTPDLIAIDPARCG